MAGTSDVDVLIIEDVPTEVNRIGTWLGLSRSQYAVSETFLGSRDSRTSPTSERADQGLRKVLAEIGRVDPRVVVVDLLLSGKEGPMPFNGAEYAEESKRRWKHLGVIVVTTGGDPDQGGLMITPEELEEQKKAWGIDYAWFKPRGAASEKDEGVAQALKLLIKESLRPSEHR
jgi:hypothetical protein